MHMSGKATCILVSHRLILYYVCAGMLWLLVKVPCPAHKLASIFLSANKLADTLSIKTLPEAETVVVKMPIN